MSSTVIDLFCGCGGFSLAAHNAGFKVTTSVDIDPILTSSYVDNFPSSKLLLADIATLSGKTLVDVNGGVPDGIIGGPPCQGFSLIGKRDQSDGRNDLLKHFFRLVMEVRPKFFIMENVPGLLTPKSIDSLSKAIDIVSDYYTILTPKIFDAANLGAATRRKRVLVIGYDPRYCDEPKPPTPSNFVSVRDAISDLPSERNSQTLQDGYVFRKLRKTYGDYGGAMRDAPSSEVGSTLFLDMLKNGYVSGCVYTKHTKPVEERFKALRQGETDKISRYTKLRWDGPCNTLRAGTGKDKGSFQAARPIHPRDNRVINAREAARLQGFPDWYAFHKTTWHSFRMIGNSVAPIMGKAVLDSLYDSCFRR